MWCGAALARAGNRGTRRKEHAIPEWIHEAFDLRAVEGEVVLDRDGDAQVLRRQFLGAFQAGNCCGRCNHGWMSDMEVAVQPILTPLVHGERNLSSLDEGECKVLSLWVCKTAYSAMAAAAGCEVPVPQDHVRHLYEQRELPPLVAVAAGQFSRAINYGLMITKKWAVHGQFDLNEIAQLRAAGYKVVLQIVHVILMVMSQPVKHFNVGFNPEAICIPGSNHPRLVPGPAEAVPTVGMTCSQIMDYFSGQAYIDTGVDLRARILT